MIPSMKNKQIKGTDNLKTMGSGLMHITQTLTGTGGTLTVGDKTTGASTVSVEGQTAIHAVTVDTFSRFYTSTSDGKMSETMTTNPETMAKAALGDETALAEVTKNVTAEIVADKSATDQNPTYHTTKDNN